MEKPDFAYLNDLVPDAIIDLRYASSWNFMGRPAAGYLASRPSLVRVAAEALAQAAEDFRRQGYRLLIYDAYRPQRAVNDFICWAQNPAEQGNKSFFPNLAKERIFPEGYLSRHSRHSRGSAIDITLVHADGSAMDMGGTFDLFDNRSHRDFAGLTAEQQANRELLAGPMVAHGFGVIRSEWWHFNFVDEPYPDTYFDFEVK